MGFRFDFRSSACFFGNSAALLYFFSDWGIYIVYVSILYPRKLNIDDNP